MNKEEIEKVLEELNQVNPSHLNNKALRLFNAIMSIADERDLLQQENKQLKELIGAILNWNIFKSECPMSYGYDKNTIEDKAQEVFCKDDDYCENNCNDDYKKCWLKYFREMQELEKGDDKDVFSNI